MNNTVPNGLVLAAGLNADVDEGAESDEGLLVLRKSCQLLPLLRLTVRSAPFDRFNR